MTMNSLIAGNETIVGLAMGIIFALIIMAIVFHLKKIADSQENLIGFIEDDDGMLPLRNTRSDNRVRVAGKQLLATEEMVTVRFERGHPVYREI